MYANNFRIFSYFLPFARSLQLFSPVESCFRLASHFCVLRVETCPCAETCPGSAPARQPGLLPGVFWKPRAPSSSESPYFRPQILKHLEKTVWPFGMSPSCCWGPLRPGSAVCVTADSLRCRGKPPTLSLQPFLPAVGSQEQHLGIPWGLLETQNIGLQLGVRICILTRDLRSATPGHWPRL